MDKQSRSQHESGELEGVSIVGEGAVDEGVRPGRSVFADDDLDDDVLLDSLATATEIRLVSDVADAAEALERVRRMLGEVGHPPETCVLQRPYGRPVILQLGDVRRTHLRVDGLLQAGLGCRHDLGAGGGQRLG